MNVNTDAKRRTERQMNSAGLLMMHNTWVQLEACWRIRMMLSTHRLGSRGWTECNSTRRRSGEGCTARQECATSRPQVATLKGQTAGRMPDTTISAGKHSLGKSGACLQGTCVPYYKGGSKGLQPFCSLCKALRRLLTLSQRSCSR